jgi:hypothetical protein
VVVSNAAPAPGMGDREPTYEVELEGGLRLDDFFYRLDPLPAQGVRFSRADGILRLGNGLMKLEPRDVGDLEQAGGPPPVRPVLEAFGPPDTAVVAGARGVPENAAGMPLTLTLDGPAPAGGAVVSLVSANAAALTVPATVTVPAGDETVRVSVTAVSVAADVEVAATYGAVTLRANVDVLEGDPGPGPVGGDHLVISEVDYDQEGGDAAEFIEVHNPTNAAVALDGYTLELVNGSNGEVYDSFDLVDAGAMLPAGGFLVVGAAPVLGPLNPPVLELDLAGAIQNGAPDGVRLMGPGGQRVDGLAYEGEVPMTGEGMPVQGDPGDAEAQSISRCLDRADTNDNLADFALLAPSPGVGQTCR